MLCTKIAQEQPCLPDGRCLLFTRTAFFSGMAAQQEQRKAIAQASGAAALPCWAKFLWQDPAIGYRDQLA